MDFANTVIYPNDPERRADRLHDATDLKRWARSAAAFGDCPESDGEVSAVPGLTTTKRLHRAREARRAIDRVFRPLAEGAEVPTEDFQSLVALYREELSRLPIRVTERGLGLSPGLLGGRRVPLLATITQSALSLAFSPRLTRLKSCPNCGWLFVDNSRARRRIWCDMRVCGNRAKARRHYYRSRHR